MNTFDIVIIGGGPAGLAAAVAAKQDGCDNVLILERDQRLGGILNQCIHNGFGLHTFKEELTGPEYAQRYVDRATALGIPYKLNTMVLTINKEKQITYMNYTEGVVTIEARAIILAMGCRERARGALTIPGSRPAGIYTAGTAQRLVNIEGYMPGKKVVILGSGDIGLIMARRLTLEGAEVKLVAEIMPYSGGLKRNIVQCLDDYGIPLQLSHTVTDIKGKERVEGVTIAEVDAQMRPIPGTEKDYACDTLLLSVGLIPENELSEDIGLKLEKRNGPAVNESFETSVPGIFACGNVLHVHDLVDYVSEEAQNTGRCAVRYLNHPEPDVVKPTINLKAGAGVAYTVPSTIHVRQMPETLAVRFRVTGIFQHHAIGVHLAGQCIQRRKKRVFSPGEMESIVLKRSDLEAAKDGDELSIGIEEVS